MEAITLANLKVGDTVTRNLAGAPHELKVTELTPDTVVCDLWEFCRKTGAEIDEDLEWGPKYGKTGSYLMVRPDTAP